MDLENVATVTFFDFGNCYYIFLRFSDKKNKLVIRGLRTAVFISVCLFIQIVNIVYQYTFSYPFLK